MTAFNTGREEVIAYPITVGGVRTRVIEAGSGDRVLVCLHGVGSRADRFVPTIPGLVAAGFHVYAIDFPGHGFADKRDDIDYRPQAFAAYVAGVLDELHLRDVVIAGTSLGGLVAARIACDRPELVERLVLIGTMGIAPLNDADKVPPATVANGSPEAVRAKLGFLVADPANVTAAWVREESMINSSVGARGALLSAAAHLNEEANTDLQTGRLQELRPEIPVLLVWGENDRWTPVHMAYTARDLLPGSKLVVMPGCGHAPYFEDPAAFVAHVNDFVATPA
ncbi:alpha/beta hydrolase [Micromonospora zingiberis]|uniref:Alpha/beta hydrolase n=1 Tax=Micromonospora zingiberis TaxID=2053011 RepID=A0A4R0GJC0_9ACTN|nr:alpha/beta hydrolase [Micromonospora zingiberis]TCB95461.1 alpha/beta hydrolase [Micromonospora zingiberis]